MAELSAATRRRVDSAIVDLEDGERVWGAMPLRDRAELLRATRRAVGRNAKRWATQAATMKAIPAGSQLEGEEWLSGPYAVLSALDTLAESLRRLSEGGSPLDGERLRPAIGGRVAVRALPRTPIEGVLLNGFTVDVWLRQGVTADQARRAAGLGSREPSRTGGIGLVLGAGNITAIPSLDVLYELVAFNRVVLLKLNPVMDAMLPVFEAAFAPLVRTGVLRIVPGAETAIGPYLTKHPRIAHVHITGSIVSHDAIVYGGGEEGRQRKAVDDPVLDKPITSELGGVSPIIVVPGRWSADDLRFQAEHVATQRLHNGGYNCIAGQTVVLSADWPQREAFLAELRSAMERAPARPAWYPGSDDRLAGALERHPEADRLAGGTRLIIDSTPGRAPVDVETVEYFAPVLGVLELPGRGADFLEGAIARVNRDFAGTLGANVIAHPATLRRMGERFERLIATLRYGTIAINAWTGVGFATAAAPWGAFPGNTLADAGSGIGIVHNALLLADTERTIVRGPFRPFPTSFAAGEFTVMPKPPWFVTSRSAALTGRRMVAATVRPGIGRLIRVFAAAFRA